MKELDFKLETVDVKGGPPIKMTVRNVFYKGFWGKLMTRINWFLRGEMSFQEYLDSPVTYERVLAEDIETYHGLDVGAELTRMLKEEVEKEMEKEKIDVGDDIRISPRGTIAYLVEPEPILDETYEPVSREQWKMLRDLEPNKFQLSYDDYVEMKRKSHESMIESRKNVSHMLEMYMYSLDPSDIENTKKRLNEIETDVRFYKWMTDEKIITKIKNYE